MAPPNAAEPSEPRRLCIFNGGFLTQKRLRRILDLAGWQVRVGKPAPGDWIGVWGKSPTSHRGEGVAEQVEAPILRVEDPFLRSVQTGRSGAPPMGLLLDERGVHFDASVPSDLEHLLTEHPLDDTALLNRARAAADWLQAAHLSKYNAFEPDLAVPDSPYVLVIDQTIGDASITHGGGSAAMFREMLVIAQEENPRQRVVIKSHPETQAGQRQGHYGPDDIRPHISLVTDPVSPWALFEGATSVYTVSSQLGFEAIYAGHKPRVFGKPFYAGWGLTLDENPVPRRERKLTRAQLFAAAMILYPTWYDPYRDQLCEVEDVIAALDAQANAWRADHRGYVASGMRLWKRGAVQKMLGREKRVIFDEDQVRAANKAEQDGRRLAVWAGKESPLTAHRSDVVRIEDGFLRSRGLGAALVPPLSLVTDDLGIYYDPSQESRLDRLITEAAGYSDDRLWRAERLIAQIIQAGVSKYNLVAAKAPDLPDGHRILVVGQVEDDASLRLGCGAVATNRALLAAARAAHPDAVLIYKPHPDVEAGLRRGALSDQESAVADRVVAQADPLSLIDAVDAVWTMTSLLGFEAVLRRKPVTCLGTPFYAGWGLTDDHGPVAAHRTARPRLAALVHAALIAYPRYYEPVTGLACPPEVAIARLAGGDIPAANAATRVLSKLQGLFASQSWLWR